MKRLKRNLSRSALHRRIFVLAIIGHLCHGCLSVKAATFESMVSGFAALTVAALHLTERGERDIKEAVREALEVERKACIELA